MVSANAIVVTVLSVYWSSGWQSTPSRNTCSFAEPTVCVGTETAVPAVRSASNVVVILLIATAAVSALAGMGTAVPLSLI